MFINLDATQGEIFPFQNSTINLETGEPIFEDPALDDKGKPVAKVGIRSMQPFFEERLSKRKKKIEHVYNAKTRQMERISFFEDLSIEEAKAERDDAYDYAITSLEGFRDSKTGKVIECTRENKIALMRVPAFDRFFARCQQLLSSSGVKRQEELEKNLQTGLSGLTPTNPE